jgi:hypothetical protein
MPVRVIYDLQPTLANVLEYLVVTAPSLDLAPEPGQIRGYIHVVGEDDNHLPVDRMYYPISSEDWIIRSPDFTETGQFDDVLEDLTSLLPFYVVIRSTLNSDPIVLWDTNQGSAI